MLTPLRAFLLAISAFILAPIPSQATDGYWEFGSWRVFVDEVDTGEDVRRTCSATTGGDGDMSAVLTISNGDAGPPDYFPDVVIQDSAPRHHATVLKQDAPLYVRFDDADVIDGHITQFTDGDGIQNAEVSFAQAHSQWVLLAMKRNSQMDVVMNHDQIHTFFLDGFTASYLKMMDECGFTGAGVLDQK